LSVHEILFVQGFCPFLAIPLAFYHFSISLETIACMLFLLFQQALNKETQSGKHITPETENLNMGNVFMDFMELSRLFQEIVKWE